MRIHSINRQFILQFAITILVKYCDKIIPKPKLRRTHATIIVIFSPSVYEFHRVRMSNNII